MGGSNYIVTRVTAMWFDTISTMYHRFNRLRYNRLSTRVEGVKGRKRSHAHVFTSSRCIGSCGSLLRRILKLLDSRRPFQLGRASLAILFERKRLSFAKWNENKLVYCWYLFLLVGYTNTSFLQNRWGWCFRPDSYGKKL